MSVFIVTPDQLTSVQDAVNKLIVSMGEAPVDSIDPPPTSDVEIALGFLNMTDLMVQGEGWTWNREESYPLALDSDGKVPLPNQTLEVSAAYYSSRSVLNVVQRGAFLYDRNERSLVFSEAPIVDIIIRVPWEDLPSAARVYITYAACQEFQASMTERSVVLRVNEGLISKARLILDQSEDRVAQLNSVSGNVSAQTAISGLGGLNRNRRMS